MTGPTITGWGRTPVSTGRLTQPTSVEQVAEALAGASSRGVIARGLGRSYGDPAQNAGGTVLDMTAMQGITAFDPESGVVTALAGTSLGDLMRWLIPEGWFVPVTPGTRHVTVGGAIANDIHGKNHHSAGSWGRHVTAMTLVTPANGIVTVAPDSDPDLFWATIGGIGLTGIIVDATFRMHRISTSTILADTDKTPDAQSVMDLMTTGDADYEYSVAWIDLSSTGSKLGRSVLDRGRFAEVDELDGDARHDPLAYDARELLKVPITAPRGLLNPLTVRAFNEAWFRKAPKRHHRRNLTIPAYFHPLDMLGNWNRGYGPAGLLQWQIIVPFGAEETMHRVISELAATQVASVVNVLKRFGPANPGFLSFPREGWTLSVDLAADVTRAGPVLDRLDRWVIEAGGRHYLAKDSRMRPETFAAGYPRLDEFRAVRDRVDPEHVLRNDLARRLEMV
ncbi:MAG: FAD-binding oxidoreductase [Actinobacteria bacterium]|nr:FAD-binding oxidoreductase [Actinomycetota bacterium]